MPAWAEDHGELGVEDDWEAWFTHNSYAEWYFNTIRIPGSPAAQRHKDLYGAAPYDAFLDAWDPDAWDPGEWMRLFHRAGAGYAVLTTKHHDGVTLWEAPETGTRNTVRRGPCTDLVAGFADAARDKGLRVGLYYSGGLDWHYRPHRPILSEDDCKDLCRPKDADYARYCFVHVRDLIDRYAPDVVWNDIDWPDEGKNFGPYGLGTLFEYFYAARPEGVTNDRYGGVHADYLTSEYQHMGDLETSGTPWENCRGVGLSFGYNRAEGEHQYLSGAGAVRHLWTSSRVGAASCSMWARRPMGRSRASSACAWRAWARGTTCMGRSCAACGRCRPPKSARSVLTCAMARTRPGCVFSFTTTTSLWWRMPPCQQCRVCRRASTTRDPRSSRQARRARGMGRA